MLFDTHTNLMWYPDHYSEEFITGQWKVNDIVAGTKFPTVSQEVIQNFIYENWKRFLPEYA